MEKYCKKQKTKQESVTIAKLIANWASLPTYATNRNTISIGRQLAKFRDWKEYGTHAKSQVFKLKPKQKHTKNLHVLHQNNMQ